MKRECLVRGNKVFFYGDMAIKVAKAISLSGKTDEQWLSDAIDNYLQSKEFKSALKCSKR